MLQRWRAVASPRFFCFEFLANGTANWHVTVNINCYWISVTLNWVLYFLFLRKLTVWNSPPVRSYQRHNLKQVAEPAIYNHNCLLGFGNYDRQNLTMSHNLVTSVSWTNHVKKKVFSAFQSCFRAKIRKRSLECI